MQWKRMDWPIMVDSLGLLGVTVVPITIAIDEYGVIRRIGIPMREAESYAREFVAQRFDPPSGPPPPAALAPDLEALGRAATGRNNPGRSPSRR